MGLDPSRLVIMVDTREQAPLDLSPMPMERATLPTGDYSLAAAPELAVIERKSVSDLLSCIGRERQRFEAELMRLRAYPARVVLIEGSWPDLFNDPRCKISSEAITGTIAAWQARYCGFFFAGNRDLATSFAKRFFMTIARRLAEQARAFQGAMEAQAHADSKRDNRRIGREPGNRHGAVSGAR